ncbi:glycosyltransferase family 2 protein [Pleomorphomonas sp. NRK KF1]|uniref:glycosyltransferase family 2 protein n=1 Tax=Pleomorphomonas sp. NRK KF1 TaxID=2943000 RepID=UPI0020434120|nr:glycosyltransferase family 2 protein [Pleomorphomonas sp. NRK KF1]MCM5552862.1 glycosyltransferase family 2 protein [Pleomorphomonas sp. NRK KF1]
MTAPTFTCLVPAFNEAERLPGVLAAVVGHPSFERVVVVDDGSTDGTGDIALRYGAEVLRTPCNGGKTRALRLGLETVRTSHVVLIDADLLGLTPAVISSLIAPVATGTAYASVSLRGNSPWVWRRIGIDYISGERVVPMELIAGRLEALDRLCRFGFEVFLNELLVATGRPIAIVQWPEVASPAKATKRGLWRGLLADVAMLSDIARTIGVMGFVGQIRQMRRLSAQ